MSDNVSAYPLCWPAGWPRTRHPVPSRFQLKRDHFARIRDGIFHQIKLLGGENAVISTDISQLRADGLPMAKYREPDDHGVAVYWYDPETKVQQSMACDRWDAVHHNMRSVELSIDCIRSLGRYGSTDMVRRAFSGFRALPPASGDEIRPAPPMAVRWREILGFQPGDNPPLGVVRKRYLELCRIQHPDKGGGGADMSELNEAWKAAKATQEAAHR